MYILGIESSCDDTSIAILKDNQVLSCITKNNAKQLDPFGGIVPEIVARFHQENIIPCFLEALENANIQSTQIDKIAYTQTPGLVGSLFVGEVFAKSLAFALGIEAIGLNHIHGHILSPFINSNPIYPFLALIASGKTTSIFLVQNANNIIELNKTKDDAIGEAFDKVGKELGYQYPAGPLLDKNFDINKATLKFSFPSVESDFSFSGIKNKFKTLIQNEYRKNKAIDTITIGSSFVKYTIDLIIKKLVHYQKKYNVDVVTIGGGVASNSYFQSCIKTIFKNSFVPLKQFATDNAAMMAYLYYQKSLI
ncbi:MAG: tRNA (adenosine(37)-N6)-threonylcarbamoyltransferase complex transferase subunit TsaD [Malacoplasma sp.]|nr:tRNA (adenosine(37)-N6)-threonylcarbamoyltransferase complex transferase subunit TsaD [Malacoplasma sp.]